MLSQFGREQQAIAAYEDLLSRFGDANEQVLLEQVADALLGKGLSLLQLSDFEQASKRAMWELTWRFYRESWHCWGRVSRDNLDENGASIWVRRGGGAEG